MIIDYLVVHRGGQLISPPLKRLLPNGLMEQTRMWFFGNIQTPGLKINYGLKTVSVDLEVELVVARRLPSDLFVSLPYYYDLGPKECHDPET